MIETEQNATKISAALARSITDRANTPLETSMFIEVIDEKIKEQAMQGHDFIHIWSSLGPDLTRRLTGETRAEIVQHYQDAGFRINDVASGFVILEW